MKIEDKEGGVDSIERCYIAIFQCLDVGKEGYATFDAKTFLFCCPPSSPTPLPPQPRVRRPIVPRGVPERNKVVPRARPATFFGSFPFLRRRTETESP